MTGLLAGISGQLPRRLLFGTLLPVVVFALAAQWALAPWWSAEGDLARTVATLEPRWQLAIYTLAAVVGTGLLHALNVPLIRLYEGYPWVRSVPGRALAGRARRRRWQLAIRQKYYGRLVRALAARNAKDPRLGDLRTARDGATRRLNDSFPKAGSVLPTRLGNTIRAFENYPERQYGFSGIALWPRIAARLPADQAAQIDGAKTRLDFMLNASFLSLVLALLLAVVAMASTGADVGRTMVGVAGCSFLAHLFYRGSLGAAAEWGGTVKTAFDLGRRGLLEALGCEISPATLAEEREVWKELSPQIAFVDGWNDAPPSVRYRKAERDPEAPTFARDAEGFLEVARGVEPIDPGSLRVVLEVRNRRSKPASDVEVRDTPPTGWALRWGSASLEGEDALPSGATTLRFSIASLPAGGAAAIRYTLVRVGGPRRPTGD